MQKKGEKKNKLLIGFFRVLAWRMLKEEMLNSMKNCVNCSWRIAICKNKEWNI